MAASGPVKPGLCLLGERDLIFLTLGTQLPFDRLVRALDAVAAGLDEEIFGQIGKGAYAPAHFPYVESLSPDAFNEKFACARVVVGHAGIGTILTGQKAQKPLVLMARRASFGEHRNDHQLATISQVCQIPGIHIAEDKDDLAKLLAASNLSSMKSGESQARLNLISSLREEIFS